MLSKIKETTKASDDEIGRNLMGLARARPDVFGAQQCCSVHACTVIYCMELCSLHCYQSTHSHLLWHMGLLATTCILQDQRDL